MKARPQTLEGSTTKVRTPFGNMYLTICEMDGKPFEVFAEIGKSGQDVKAFTEAIGRLISLHLRTGGKVKDIWEQLIGIGGNSVVPGDKPILSVPDAIGRKLKEVYDESTNTEN
jgi:ribonucleoside-diphosphate reductase alpha chain